MTFVKFDPTGRSQRLKKDVVVRDYGLEVSFAPSTINTMTKLSKIIRHKKKGGAVKTQKTSLNGSLDYR